MHGCRFLCREGFSLATTTLLQRHANEGESIAGAIRDCLDYGKNPEKTEAGKYISFYECDPATVAAEFLLAKASYKATTGREQKKGSDVLCYQMRQSFYPREITPEEANRVSYELAMRWTKCSHAFIVTTHTDKQHIHSHIYYNSTTLDCTRKFRNFWGSSFALRRLSDRLCLENGLSIVENPKPRSKGKFRNYGEWQTGQKKPLTYQDILRVAIDTALAYLQDNSLTDYEQLEQKATAATEHFHKLSDQIKSTEAVLHTNMELKAATVQYAKTRPVFEKYKASKYSKKFLAEYEADIELYRAACADFKAILGGVKLPKMDTLKEEGRKLAKQKKKLYAEYCKAKADMQKVTTIKTNIDYLLGYSEPGRRKEQER